MESSQQGARDIVSTHKMPDYIRISALITPIL